MDITQELKEAIEKIIIGTKHKNIIEESQSISKKYRENDGKGKKIVTKQSEAVAYSISRMPATYCVVYTVFSKIFRNYNKEIKTVLDVGAGTGAATWALQEFLKPQKIMCLEREQAMRDIGKQLMYNNFGNVEWNEFDLISDNLNEKADLVVTSYVINELSEENRRKAIEKMWEATNGLLVIIEPGTPEGFKHINEARELLLSKNANVVVPCSHNGKCPINTQEDWCSFYVRVARSGIQRQAKKGELGYEDEKFSYIAFSKTPVAVEPARILRHPQINSGYVKVKLCTPNGLEEKTFSKKDGEFYKKIRKLDAGDTI
ncbi:MAG: methyltransferase domain-containing protein [Clostridia bacterium]|nr:methyltransferase domain-containing protein [Clostridia bacterium]